ncbi:MAG: SIS domain-containing protein [Chloroflexi bacterium]|nr:SIS domain-containing protein [Chloroflexota bacterium]
MSLYTEIIEQPSRLSALLVSQRKHLEKVAQAIRARDMQNVFLAARGTSDNACRYANYVLGAYNGLPVALAAPSLFTYYQQPPKLRNTLVVGISQSGQSPDIVRVLDEGKRQGNLTLAITNDQESPLAKAADFVLDIQAGPELAVAATKTYTAELMTVAMLSVALSDDKTRWNELASVSDWVSEVLKQDEYIQSAAQRYRYMQQCVVLGRGYNYSTTFEWALKLKELTYTAAEPYSSADFQHGPVAMVSHGFPVLAVAPTGKVFDSMLKTLTRLKMELSAELVIISNSPEALKLAQVPLTIPINVPEWLSPVVSIVPAQLFSYYLTLAKGYNPDAPRTISKVTETR